MANSKASLSIGLLFFVFLSSQVLAHDEEHETSHLNTDGIHPARAAANDNHPPAANDNNPGGRPGGGVAVANYPQKSVVSYKKESGYNPSKLNDIDTDGIHHSTAAANNNHPPTANDNPSSGTPTSGVVTVGYSVFPSPPLMPPIEDKKATGYNPSKLNDIEPENHEHGYVIKDDSTKPSEIDQRKSLIFMTKTTPGMRNSDSKSYSNLGVEDVGEKKMEDET